MGGSTNRKKTGLSFLFLSKHVWFLSVHNLCVMCICAHGQLSKEVTVHIMNCYHSVCCANGCHSSRRVTSRVFLRVLTPVLQRQSVWCNQGDHKWSHGGVWDGSLNPNPRSLMPHLWIRKPTIQFPPPRAGALSIICLLLRLTLFLYTWWMLRGCSPLFILLPMRTC